MDKNLLVQVFVTNGDGHGRCGTAYPVAPNRLITAAHVIEDALPKQIELSWYHLNDEERGWRRCTKVLWDGRPNLDVAILEAEFPESVIGLHGVLAYHEPKTDERWESEGFPIVGIRDDDWTAVPLKGAMFALGNQSRHLQLEADAPTNLPHGWRGASGSPVISGNGVVGVIVFCPHDFANERLEAVPAFRLLNNEDFTAALGLSEDDQRRLLKQKASSHLVSCAEALAALSDRIDVPQLPDQKTWSDNTIERLLEICALPTIITTLVVVMNYLDKQENREAAKNIERLAYYVVPAALSQAHVTQMKVITDAESPQYGFQAKTRTLVELAIARINGREAMFREIASQTDAPSGRFCLRNPPEEGMDEHQERFVNNFVSELGRIVGSDLVGDTQDDMVEAINAELESQFEIEGWQYYYVFDYPRNIGERKQRQKLAEELDKMFPKIAFVVLDRAESTREELNVVQRMMRIFCHAAGIEYKPHGTD